VYHIAAEKYRVNTRDNVKIVNKRDDSLHIPFRQELFGSLANVACHGIQDLLVAVTYAWLCGESLCVALQDIAGVSRIVKMTA
jgi:hypothetical protein